MCITLCTVTNGGKRISDAAACLMPSLQGFVLITASAVSRCRATAAQPAARCPSLLALRRASGERTGPPASSLRNTGPQEVADANRRPRRRFRPVSTCQSNLHRGAGTFWPWAYPPCQRCLVEADNWRQQKLPSSLRCWGSAISARPMSATDVRAARTNVKRRPVLRYA